MMTSSRPRDPGGSFASRRGHANTLSISDPTHHVTEAIGTLYGSDDEPSDTESHDYHRSRPWSFVDHGEYQLPPNWTEVEDSRSARPKPQRSPTDNSLSPQDAYESAVTKRFSTTPSMAGLQKNLSYENGTPSPLSPTLSLRGVQTAEGSMSMTNIEDPNDIAQELSNLQALRRMSMDVGNSSDPDLMPFQGIVPIPSIAPSGDDDESDPSRLLWVPANVHPELAPEQFKSFLERRVNSMKRMSGESMLSPDVLQSCDSFGSGFGSLRRTRSKLSRQIDNSGGRGGDGYVDGAEKLVRLGSINGYATPELSLDELVKDPAKAVQKLTQDASEGSGTNDVILPVAPGMGLRRSTRTQYRKSGSMRVERPTFSKRMAQKLSETQEETVPTSLFTDVSPGNGSNRVQSEPATAENFSRPKRSIKRQQGLAREAAPQVDLSAERPNQDEFQQLLGRSRSNPEDATYAVEEAPQTEQLEPVRQYPERLSSQKSKAELSPQVHALQVNQHRQPERAVHHTLIRNDKHPPPGRHGIAPASLDNFPVIATQTINDIAVRSGLPGSSLNRTDSLAVIPTFGADNEKKKRRDSDSESTKSSSGWKWFKSEDKKKKDKEKERDEQARRPKLTKSVDKAHENARLDVLQSSTENVATRGRESLLLDRDSIDNKLQEERKKESSRKLNEGKKEKDGFFGSIFSSKKKGDKDVSSSKKQLRAASPDPPPPRLLKPDVDYPYTRFPILEERAIYRMAHIKLANPKRNLLSQLQVPVSPQQKRLEEERRRKEQEAQQAHMEQQMHLQQSAQNSIDQYNFEYHRAENQYGDTEGDYLDEHSGPYDCEQGRRQQDGSGYRHDGYRHQQQRYYDGHDPQRHQDEDVMW